MFRVLVLTCLVLSLGFGSKLQLQDGLIKAHTEVFGDSTIDPETKDIKTDLTIQKSLESITGKIFIKAGDLVSDNKDRDSHMYKSLKIASHPLITYRINSISKKADKENSYILKGVLELHGIKKQLAADAVMVQKKGLINIRSNFFINMSDFGVEPPVLLFLSVRDRVDIDVNINLKGK